MLMSAGSGAATLYFQPNGFRVVRSGSYVVCAVSGEQIALEALRYWSVTRQEAYASPELATKRLLAGA
jgi:hypothetical protein